MKVRAYLALTAIAVLVPVIVFATAALNMLLDDEREAALNVALETARASALIVDRELASAEATLRVLGNSQHLAQHDLAGFYEEAKRVATNEHAWIVLFDHEGQQLLNTSVPRGTPLPKRRRPEQGREVIQTQSTWVSNLILGPVMRQHIVSVETSVPAGNGRRYVLSQAFLASHFRHAFDHPGISPGWIIGIFDREGTTLARNRAHAQYVGKPTIPELMKAAAKRHEGVLRAKSLDGEDIYGVFTHSARSGWIVAIGAPVNHIEAAARKAVTVATLGLLAALACAALVAIFLGRRLALSITNAAQAAASLGHGEKPVFAASGVEEVDKLQAALVDAGAILERERQSRERAEAERFRLFASEQEARRLAETQNKAKDEFLAMLGHELRNPLSAISNAVTLMETGELSGDSARRACAVIGRQSQHLSRIVDDLLDLSRVMSGKVFLNRHRINLHEAVRNCIGTLTATHRLAGKMVGMSGEPVWIDADPTRLEQIVTNLLVNAAKYTPDGGRIDVEVHADDGKAVLVVRDSGVGIGADLLPHIFDVFVQGPAQLARSQGGLGIGLSLVRTLVTLHGGAVTAESAGAGQGSTFTVTLPLAEQQHGTEEEPAALPTAGEGRQVLLVEDNADSRETLSALLEIYGFQVNQAGDGSAGLQLAQDTLPDIAVIDIGLPGVDGYEVARRLRAAPATRSIALIALTGYGQTEDRQRALDAGFDTHLVKPVDTARLLEAISRLCPA